MNWQERAEKAEAELAKLREQKPVAWINLNKWTPSNGPRCVTHEEYEKERELLTKLTAVYAAPVPAVAAGLPAIGPYRDFIPAPAVPAPSVPEEWREVMTELADDLAIEIDQSYPPERRAYPSEQRRYEREMEIVNRARALLQSSQAAPAVQKDCVSQDESTMMMAASALVLYRAGESAEYMAKAIEALLQSSDGCCSQDRNEVRHD
jgi:hypothetical protein